MSENECSVWERLGSVKDFACSNIVSFMKWCCKLLDNSIILLPETEMQHDINIGVSINTHQRVEATLGNDTTQHICVRNKGIPLNFFCT